ncbi:MAG: ribosome biogenesis GTPase Der, partial [Thermodesulfobacteriota bacterium]
EKGKGCILIVNKWDLVEKDSQTIVRYEREVRENLKYLSYAPILFISALTGQRVGKVLDMVEDVSAQTRKRIPTAQLNRYFGKWVEQFPPPLHRNRIVKMNYITQVSVSPPTFVIYTNIQGSVHFSYERYLTNKMREAFGFEGVSVRLLFRKKGRKADG